MILLRLAVSVESMEGLETRRALEAEPIAVVARRVVERIAQANAAQMAAPMAIQRQAEMDRPNTSALRMRLICSGGMVQTPRQFSPIASNHMVRIAPMIGSLCRSDMGQAACEFAADSADKFFGSGFPDAFATSLKWARRDAGMPIDFQLWTVETGASINRATAEVPPK